VCNNDKSMGLHPAKREYIKLLIRIAYKEVVEPVSYRDQWFPPLPHEKLAFSNVRKALEYHSEIDFIKEDMGVIYGLYEYTKPPTLNMLCDEALLYIYSKLKKIEEKLK